MRTLVSVLALMAYLVAPASAQQAMRVEIVDFGLYHITSRSTGRDAKGMEHHQITGTVHLSTTTVVPAQLGTSFGMRWRFIDAGKANIQIREVALYPKGGIRPPGSKQPLRKVELMQSLNPGAVGELIYTFVDPWEMVPGPWTIQLFAGGRKLAEQGFTVIKP